jgi:hypothetical protein
MTIYLYVKTHRVTGLKYLGKTTKDPYRYKGSGKYWSRHIEKHGYDVDTEVLIETTDSQEIKEKGLYYSNLWNVVDSKEWANLSPEQGDGGARVRSKESIERIRSYQKNKIWTEKAIANRTANCLKAAAARKGSTWKPEHRKSRMNTYVIKNLEIANKIFELADSGYNKLTISKMLNISWEKVHYPMIHRAEFEAHKETKNYQET